MKPKGRQSNRRMNGRISAARESWVRVGSHEFMLYVFDPDEPDDDDAGDLVGANVEDLQSFRLSWQNPKRRGLVSIGLASLRVDELEALREFLNRAIDMARPVAAELDRRAQEALETGDDSYARIYRPVPQLIVRPRPQRGHDQGVPQRPDAVPPVDERAPDPGESAGDAGGDVDHGEPLDVVGQDDGAQADGAAIVGEVDG